MLYRENPKNGDKLSQLGFGCMRLPRKGASIDIPRSTAMIRGAIDKGVNYFDTAYIYPGSEVALGKALSGGYREKVKIATKLPLLMIRSAEDFDKYFDKHLQRLQTDYIDYYLMHMLIDMEHFQKYLDMGFESWVIKQKAAGKIRNIGFSFHGRQESFNKILDSYDWEFCMIQYNYIDENHQAGKKGLEYAYSKGIPVMIMEPLRGGKLANGLPPDAVSRFASVNPVRPPAEWGLRWVWNHREPILLLSGMGDEKQIECNIRTASDAKPGDLNNAEISAYADVLSIMRQSIKVGCTGCGYCLPCPANVDIPGCFSNYNDLSVKRRLAVISTYAASHGVIPKKPTFASLCKRCGKCEKHCPQDIKIIETLSAAAKELEPFWLKPAAKVAKLFTVGNN